MIRSSTGKHCFLLINSKCQHSDYLQCMVNLTALYTPFINYSPFNFRLSNFCRWGLTLVCFSMASLKSFTVMTASSTSISYSFPFHLTVMDFMFYDEKNAAPPSSFFCSSRVIRSYRVSFLLTSSGRGECRGEGTNYQFSKAWPGLHRLLQGT